MPSLDSFTHAGTRNCFAGGAAGSYGPMSTSSGLAPYAPQCRLYAPVSESNTTMRRLITPSATYTSLAATSTSTAAGRFKPVVLVLSPVLPALPICRRKRPLELNLSTCASGGGGGAPAPRPRAPGRGSGGPRAAIHTLPFASTVRPPGDCGQS